MMLIGDWVKASAKAITIGLFLLLIILISQITTVQIILFYIFSFCIFGFIIYGVLEYPVYHVNRFVRERKMKEKTKQWVLANGCRMVFIGAIVLCFLALVFGGLEYLQNHHGMP